MISEEHTSHLVDDETGEWFGDGLPGDTVRHSCDANSRALVIGRVDQHTVAVLWTVKPSNDARRTRRAADEISESVDSDIIADLAAMAGAGFVSRQLLHDTVFSNDEDT